ncbi:MAG: FAD-dependent oxidoreductase, partial [Opitutaceae bacterium]|nr:FAD-dependent oxidoreductase [Opitutaceae bacterium]
MNGALPKVAAPAGGLPVLAEVDVAVVGGGTSGSPAAIVAAREGMRTLEVEYQHMLGGVGTVGLVAKYWHTYTKGFPESIPGSKGYWDTRERSEWLRTEFRKAGGELWYGCVGAGAFMEGNAVKGVVVATPLGRGVVLAKRVIDGTGNADVAAAAGAETSRPGAGQVAVQGTGLPPVRLGGRDFINTDWTIVDDNDLVDMWRAHLYARLKFADAFDTAPFINSRERRRIVSDYDLTIVDELNGRTFPDTVVLSHTNLDQHGFSVARLLELSHPDRRTKMTVRLPYRVMLPRGVENLLVIGLGMGVEHDALPLVRLQATLIHQGVAAAVAAAQSIRAGAGLRQTDIRAVQRRLVELGGLPEEITGETDSYPLSDAALEAAARALPETPSAAAALFTDPARARPLLRKALAEAPGAKERFAYARALGLLDDPAGRAVLMEFLKDNGWDEAWNYRGMGNFGATLSVMDSVILTLGRLGVAEAAPLILEKAARLEPGKAFSHYRAVCLALEALRDTRAVPVLEKLLKAPGAGGHAVTDIRRAAEAVVPNPNSAAARRDSTVECYLARALLAC